MLTVTGFIVTVGAGYVISRGYFPLGGIIILVAGFFDILDGAVARARNLTTKFGAALDSTLDRFGEAALFLGLLLFYLSSGNNTNVVLVYISLVGSILVSYVRARAEGLGLKGERGFFTRPERIIVLAAGLIINQVTIVLWAFAILTHLTVVQRLMETWKQGK